MDRQIPHTKIVFEHRQHVAFKYMYPINVVKNLLYKFIYESFQSKPIFEPSQLVQDKPGPLLAIKPVVPFQIP